MALVNGGLVDRFIPRLISLTQRFHEQEKLKEEIDGRPKENSQGITHLMHESLRITHKERRREKVKRK